MPPRSTLFGYFQRWEYDGTLLKIHYELYQKCRELADRQASPTACIIDSQSMKSAEQGGSQIDPSGYDAGKKIKGKKRHILVDTEGLLMHAVVHPADVQERDFGDQERMRRAFLRVFGQPPQTLRRMALSKTNRVAN